MEERSEDHVTGETGRKECAANNCTSSFAPHRWGNQAAQNEGWFLQRNGQAWCPDHIPDWVASWRARKNSTGGDK